MSSALPFALAILLTLLGLTERTASAQGTDTSTLATGTSTAAQMPAPLAAPGSTVREVPPVVEAMAEPAMSRTATVPKAQPPEFSSSSARAVDPDDGRVEGPALKGRTSAALMFTAAMGSKLVDDRGVFLAAQYNLSERFGLGLAGGYFFGRETDILQAIRRQGVDPGNPQGGQRPLGDLHQMRWMVGGDVAFTPVRGNLPFGAGIDPGFELQLLGGLGFGQTRRGDGTIIDQNGRITIESYQSRLSPMFTFGAAFNLNIVRWLALRLEYRNFLFPEPGDNVGGINSRPHAQVGLQFNFGGASETISYAQAPAHPVAGKFELSSLFSASLFDRFVASEGVSASIAYHLTDNWAVQLTGAKHFPHQTRLVNDILREYSFIGSTRGGPTESQLLWMAGVDVQWSPLSGNLNLFSHTFGLTPFIGVGIGLGETRVQCDAGQRLDPDAFGADARCPLIPPDSPPSTIVFEPNTLRPLGTLSAGLRIDVMKRLALKFEFKDTIYRSRVVRPDSFLDDQVREATRHTVFTNFGLSLLLGG